MASLIEELSPEAIEELIAQSPSLKARLKEQLTLADDNFDSDVQDDGANLIEMFTNLMNVISNVLEEYPADAMAEIIIEKLEEVLGENSQSNIASVDVESLIDDQEKVDYDETTMGNELITYGNLNTNKQAAEARTYESILHDLMEAAAKKKRIAQQPKKIKITKRQLQELMRRQIK